MQLITLHNDTLTIVISTLGAEMQSIRDQNGIERLWQGDPAFWTGRAPILFPVAGGFREDCYELDGVRYPMPKHGFARRSEWQVEEAEQDRAVFLLAKQTPGFPFDYELRARYALKGNAVEVSYEVSSRDERPFYFSLGAHEAYATPEGIEEYELVFDEPETLAHYPPEGQLTSRTPVIMAENARVLPLKTEYFAIDALVFLTLKSRGVTLRSRLHNRTVHVSFPGHPYCLFWTKPGAGYLCIEPWCNAPDFADADLRIDHKLGFLRICQGQTIVRTHTIAFGS